MCTDYWIVTMDIVLGSVRERQWCKVHKKMAKVVTSEWIRSSLGVVMAQRRRIMCGLEVLIIIITTP